MDSVLTPTSLHFPDNVRCDRMPCIAGGLDDWIGIVRGTVSYDVTECCLHRVAVDGPAII